MRPLQAENPNVVKAYGEYIDIKITIPGFSLDSKKDYRLSAMASDHINWLQVSDLKAWSNEALPACTALTAFHKISCPILKGRSLQKSAWGCFGE